MKNATNPLRLIAFLFAFCLAQHAGAAAVTWTGLAGADQTWTNTANWSGGLPQGNIVIFPSTMYPASTNAVGVTNNIINTNMTIAQLWYVNTNGFLGSGTNFNDTTLIVPYATLTVTGNMYVGPQNSVGANTVAALVGTNCGFIVSNLSATFGIGYTNNANSVQGSAFTLPDGTNFIDVGTFAVGNSVGGNGKQSVLNLGNGTNILEATIFELGWGKAQGTVQFANTNGGVLISGTNGTRAIIVTGRGSSGTANVNGQLVLTNYANVSASLTTNGWGAASSSGGSPKGTITIEDGIYDTTSLVMGANTGGTQSASGTFNIGGDPINHAMLIVNSPAGPGGGQFLLSDANNGTQTGAGTFNINTNGTAALYCGISMFGTANNTGTINLNGGTLILERLTNTIGSASVPINSVNLNGGTLQMAVDGNNTATANITASSISASTLFGPNIINISSVTNVLVPVTIHLIIGDPGLANFQLGTIPAGYNATLQDNIAGDNDIDLVIGANIPIVPVLWVGAVGSTLNSNWNFTTQDWQVLTNGAPTAYANPDLTYFDDSASNSTVTLLTNFTPGALTFSNLVLNYTLNGTGSISGSVGLIMDGSAQVTLADSGGDNFGGGITVNSGTVLLGNANSAIAGAVSIASGATLQIGNNDAKGNLPAAPISDNGTLIMDQTSSTTEASPITGGGALTLNGSGTVTLTSGANNYTGNTIVNAGKLALTGSGTISNSASVSIGSAALDVSGAGGTVLFNSLALASSTVTVNVTNAPYLQPPVILYSGQLNVSGAASTINVAGLPVIATYPTTLPLILANGGLNGFNLTLGTLPAGYTGYLTNNYNNGAGPNNTAILVLTNGPTGARPYVTWGGADAIAGVNTNWSDAQNWNLTGVPLTTDTVIFDDVDAQISSANSSLGGGAVSLNFQNVNNIVDSSRTVATLIYTNYSTSGTPLYQNTYINNGVTLTVTNSLAFGGFAANLGSQGANYVSVSGTNGTLMASNTSSTLVIGLGDTANTGAQGTLDMSGLGTFTASVGFFDVGAVNSASTNASGVAYLAQTNNIFATGGSGGANEGGQSENVSFMIGESGKNVDAKSFLYLGQQNVIHAWTMGIGLAKDPGEMDFNTIFVNPTVTIAGGDGVSPVQVWSIGDGLAQTGGSSKPTGTADFTGGTVNALVATMYIGRTPNASGPNPATGTLTFGAGTFAANTIWDGFQAFSQSDNGVGTINVNGGILEAGTINLAWTTGGAGASTTTGTLNIAGGTVGAGTISGDTNLLGQSSITLSSGTLIVSNRIGSSAAPLASLSLGSGVLQLSPNASFTNIVATSISVGGPITVNIASINTSVGGLQSIPLISYLNGSDPTTNNLILNSVPFGFTGATLVDDGVSLISLSVTAPPILVWVGAVSGGTLSGSWNISDHNWINGLSYSAYADPDFVQFTDIASNGAVNVAVNVSPDNFTVSNNVLNYAFSGTHAIHGTASLVKSGTASLTLADSGGDNFSGGITVNGGSVLLDNAGSALGGSVAIASGSSLQLGNNDANGNLPGTVTDNGSLVLDRSDNLTLGNAISGAGAISQIGTNSVTLSGGNSSFTGKLFITNGVLNTTAAGGLGGASSTVIITNGGTLDDNGIAFNGANAPTFIVSGSGYNGQGAIINNGAQQIAAFSNITVAANVTFGANTRWDIRASSGSAASLNTYPSGTPYSITKVGTNSVSLVSVGTVDASLGNIFVQQGEFAIQLSTAQLGNPASNLVVSAGAFLEMFGASTPLNKVITFNGNGTSDSFKSDSDTAGQNVIIGPVALNGNCLFDVSSGQFSTIDSVITGSGGLTKVTQGTLTLTNVNTYSGNTTINGGILAFTGSGSVASTNIVVAAGATLNASGRTNQTLTLVNGQTLSGSGTVTGLVVSASGSTVAPGPSAAIGTLACSNNVTLGGTNTMKISRVSSATNDILAVNGTLALGGTLNVTSLGGTYQLGDTFKLYSATSTTGAFAVTNLPVLGGGLGLSYGNGILTVVVGVNTNPTNIVATFSGTTLNLTWPTDHIGWRLQVQTNSLATGLNPSPAAWFTVPGSTTVNTENITVDPNQGNIFYRLVYP